jgi:protein tyrosine/serine phosphatase
MSNLARAPGGTWTTKRAWIAVCLGALVLGGGVLFWEEYLEDRLIPKRWGVVEQGKIYRSGQLHASLIEETLRENEIDVIISFRGSNDADARQEAAVARALGIERITLPLDGDGTGNLSHYATAIERLVRADNEGEATLVHCAAGTQRTGGVIAAYRVLVQGRPPSVVYEEMQQYDWDPVDDVALVRYLNKNMGKLALMLVERNVLERVPDPLPVLGP